MSDAADALALWGGTGEQRLISRRENAVYRVTLPGGPAALRLHRPGYRSAAEIRSELVWCDMLVAQGFAAPRPVPMLAGGLIGELAGGQMATVIDWMEGAPIGAVGMGLAGTGEDHYALYRNVGALLARLHNLTDALVLPDGFVRPRWDRDGLTGPNPLWGKYWEAPGLTPDEVALLIAARDRARQVLAQYDPAADVGLIHADALRENVFQTSKGLALIDFDDCGFGYRMYDLAAAVTQAVDDLTYPRIVDGLLDGYAAERGLTDEARGLFAMFAMLRSFSAIGWTIPRLATDNPRLPTYLRRAVTAAKGFLASAS